ncbi:MAG: SIS domain-containing protein [Armatimonadota bacterium]|nr:SIS domain-containing protein [Armatimonadota bacterium]MDR7464020.1 SIS domain-containing protein [Armatimonadota bacterium]MDR7474855.1 SIS domain-containing protein [Armatimonadota bacterium]MDR7539694.1 SIS domain-containing protein [Armatimonadota bacterium]
MSPLRDLWHCSPPAQLLLTGCGSSYYLALVGAHLLQAQLRVPCRALPSSEIVFAPDEAALGASSLLLVALSRSGETTETVWAVERLRERGATTVALTCSATGPLLQASHLAIPLPVEERSVVMTGSFTSMLLTLAALAAALAGDEPALAALRPAPELAAAEMTALAAHAREVAAAPSGGFVYLGTGPTFGLAAEGALKMVEMSLMPGWAYHTLEFLHGPRAAVSREMVVVGLLSAPGATFQRRVLQDVAALGARVVAVGEKVEGLPSLALPAPPGSLPAMLLGTVWLQWLALHTARARGVDPDAPRFLQPVVKWSEDLREGGEG